MEIFGIGKWRVSVHSMDFCIGFSPWIFASDFLYSVAAAVGCGRRSAKGGFNADLSEVSYRRLCKQPTKTFSVKNTINHRTNRCFYL